MNLIKRGKFAISLAKIGWYTQSTEINSIVKNAELREASCNLRLDDFIPSDRASHSLLVTDLPDCGTALLAPFDPSIEVVCRDPILATQHIRLHGFADFSL